MKINKKLKRILKFGAFFLLSVIVIILLITGIIGYFYGDKVASFIIKELNKKVKTELDVKEVKFSALRKFPNATIELKTISVAAGKDFKKLQFVQAYRNYIIKAERIFLSFNLMDIFNENYKIKWLEIENAEINILFDSENKNNFQIWETTENSGNNEFKVSLRNVSISESSVNYIDKFQKINIETKVEEGELSGDFRASGFELEILTELNIKSFDFANQNYIKNKHAFAKLTLSETTGNYKFNNAKLKINDLNFALSGIYNSKEESLSFGLKTKSLDYKKFKQTVPELYADYVPEIEADGEISFELDFQNTKDSYLKISNLEADIGENTLELEAKLTNFDFPVLELETKAEFDFSEMKNYISKLTRIDSLFTESGTIKTELEYKGKFNSNFDFGYTEAGYLRGRLEVEELKNKFNNEILELNTNIQFSDNLLEISSFDANFKDNNLELTAKSNNLFDFLTNKDAYLKFEGELHSEQLNLNEFILSDTAQTDNLQPDSVKTQKRKTLFWQKIQTDLKCDIENLTVNKFVAEKLTTDISGNSKSLWLKKLEIEAMSGKISGDYELVFTNKEVNIRSENSKFTNLNVTELFVGFENFWQETLLAENIQGTMSSENVFSIFFDYDLNMLYAKNLIHAKAKLLKGKLLNFEPLESMSGFVKIEELNKIEFSELENEFFMKDGVVSVPEMTLNSQIINMTVKGEYAMDGNYQFSVKVGLLSFLANKFKKRKTAIKDKKARLGIYLLFEGNNETYDITYDKEKIRNVLKSNLNYTKNEVNLLLKNEVFEKDTSVVLTKK